MKKSIVVCVALLMALVLLMAWRITFLVHAKAASKETIKKPVARNPVFVFDHLKLGDLNVEALSLLSTIAERVPYGFNTEDLSDNLPAAKALVGLGEKAVPAIVYMVEHSQKLNCDHDRYIRMLSWINDSRVRPYYEKWIKLDVDGEVEWESVRALGELGDDESLAILRGLVSGKKAFVNKDDSSDMIHIVSILLSHGDIASLKFVIDAGLRGDLEQMYLLELLESYEPLAKKFERGILQLSYNIDALVLFQKMDEWYHLNVLKVPSPYSYGNLPFKEPHLAVKQKAWELLESESTKVNVRVLPHNYDLTEEERKTALIFVEGASSSESKVSFFALIPKGDFVECLKFLFDDRTTNSGFPGDTGVNQLEVGRIPKKEYDELLVSFKTLFGASQINWWRNGRRLTWSCQPTSLISTFSLNGTFSKYLCRRLSPANKETIRLQAAKKVFKELVVDRVKLKPAHPEKIHKELFSRALIKMNTFLDSEKRDFSFARRMMLAMARDFGDQSLLPILMKCTDMKLGRTKGKATVLTNLALIALANITKKDFRYNSKGFVRPTQAIVGDYRRLLEITIPKK